MFMVLMLLFEERACLKQKSAGMMQSRSELYLEINDTFDMCIILQPDFSDRLSINRPRHSSSMVDR